MTVEVLVTSEEVIEVIESGPQGDKGDKGDAGSSSSNYRLFITESTLNQIIPRHLGTAETELTIDLGSGEDDFILASSGILTIKKEIAELLTTIELQAEKTAGGISRLTLWAEYSIDSGNTWNLFADSLRAVSINNDSEGVHNYDLSSLGPFNVGMQIRLKATNDGAGNLALISPSLTSSNGVISGKSSKLTMQYK